MVIRTNNPSKASRELKRKIYIGCVERTRPLKEINNYVRTKVYCDIQHHIKSVMAERNPDPRAQGSRTGVCLNITVLLGTESATALIEKGLMRNRYPAGVQQTVKWWNNNLWKKWSDEERSTPDWSS